MTVKSVIEVDVHDEAFKNFAKLFEKYQALLKETPKAWAEAGKETAAVAEGTALTAESLVASLLSYQKISEVAAAERAKAASERRKAEDERKKNEFSWSKVASAGRNLARSTLDVTRNVVKWVGIGTAFTGILGAGSLFGISELASGAGARRRAAQGFGVGIGEKQAFETNYGRLVDPDAVLGGVNTALTDPTQRSALYGAGLGEGDLRGKDTVQVAAALIPLLKKLADRTPDSLLQSTVDARNLANIGITAQDLKRLKRTSPGELGEFASDFEKNRKNLDLQDDVAKKWQDLDVRLRTSGRTIETVFIRGLAPLTKPLDHLSDSVTKAVAAFLKNPHLGEWIDDLGKALEKAAKYIGTDKFQKDVKTFVDDVAYAAGKMVDVLRFLGLIPGPTKEDAEKSIGATSEYRPGGAKEEAGDKFIRQSSDAVGKWWGGIETWWSARPNGSNLANLRVPGRDTGYAAFADSATGIRATASQLRTYENRDKLDTIEKIVARYAPKKDHNDVEAYIRDVEGRTKFGRSQHLDLKDINVISTLIAAILKHENVKNNYTPQAIVKILNATGANTIVQTSALAQ